MPWNELKIVDQRELFVRAYLRGELSLAELSRQFGIARKTGYKWVGRFMNGGMPALLDRSRAPMSNPKATPDEIVDAILDLRKKRPSWGPLKLRSWLSRKQPKIEWPSEATFARILKRHGLVRERRRMRRVPLAEHPLAAAHDPNHVWCADFKGKFRVDRRYCHPLTITDARSRFVLCCKDLGGERSDPTRAAFEATFREYGLPFRIRTDNGSPFASRAAGGLSRLSVWWVKLGILPERTRPGHPQDNGAHERMHRTLKSETAKPPRSNLRRQQIAFDEWRHDFNHERPHQALGMAVPAEFYHPSPRLFPEEVGDPEYPTDFEVRRCTSSGRCKLNAAALYFGYVLKGEAIGFEPLDDGVWQAWFGAIYLGLVTELAHGQATLVLNQPYAEKS